MASSRERPSSEDAELLGWQCGLVIKNGKKGRVVDQEKTGRSGELTEEEGPGGAAGERTGALVGWPSLEIPSSLPPPPHPELCAREGLL